MIQKLPNARNESIVVQELEKEILIYDFQIDKAYCLNETSGIIYRHCDGETSFDELKRRYKFTDDLIYLALKELQQKNLIESEEITHFAGMSRREVVRRVGLGTMFALPVISSLVAPSAANASSACLASGQACTFNNFTQSNCCSTLRCSSDAATTCVTCSGTGVFYSQTSPGTVADCNANVRKNLCCNSGDATVSNSSNCLCP